MSRDVVLIGAGGFGREAFHVIDDHNRASPASGQLRVMGVVDDDAGTARSQSWRRREVPYLGTLESWLGRETHASYFVTIGDPLVRGRLHRLLGTAGRRSAPAVVHPSATVTRTALLGAGTIVCPGVRISTEVVVGEQVHLNPQATLGHDAHLGHCVSLNPQSAVSGSVQVHDDVLIGASACVLEGRTVGAGARVGAGACVTADVRPGTTVVGVPARPTGDPQPRSRR